MSDRTADLGQTGTRSHNPASLASEALRLSGDLVRKEIALAKAEMGQNVQRAGVAVGFIVAAAVIGIVTINVLVAALVAALAETDLGPIWSAVIVGLVLALLAYILLRKGMSDLKPEALMPSRTVQNVQRDAHAIKEAYHDK
ncbi:phage holin family protein [Paracoccus tibetensis]|uniref:Putative Holin-X, holin superfamily III n=1 Tax=Paracoccus tibetensis TaxID=336292 RepID=A0A1G5BAF5_9RHOB|nr:phage holin family protein [Paracoccus tibetensis]SCX87063.1 Putative Holin-X, holin superfamily III [Paracoccus tibetensis]